MNTETNSQLFTQKTAFIVGVKTVQELMRHTSSRLTLDVYAQHI